MAETILQTDNRTILTDLYQLTMNASYFDNKKDDLATFELFIRKLPKDWGYFIANGIEDAIDYATNIRFSESDIDYIREQGMFKEEFLDFLKDFKFEGEIFAVPEGTPVTANTPLLQVRGKRTQVQFLETMLLNTINFQTMVASKASRVVNAAKSAAVVDYGLRRAQEKDASILGARACYIAGAIATSNVLAGKKYGIPIKGTHAHSFVMSFPTELDAFRAYARTFPRKPTLLIDTYDTLQGARNAVIVAKELEGIGERLGSVRLDSGELSVLSKQVRQIFDSNGLSYVKILASNDLNEYKIAELVNKHSPIDGYGVGTEMITAKPVSAISGVYKLVEDSDGAKIKLSSEKMTYPGAHQVYRTSDINGNHLYDTLALVHEKIDGTPLLEKVVLDGIRITPRRQINEIRAYSLEEVSRLPESARGLIAAAYEMMPSPGLCNLVENLKQSFGGARE